MPGRYEVTFRFEDSTNVFGYNDWSAVWTAENFAEAERKALAQLVLNGDNHSFIQKIELY